MRERLREFLGALRSDTWMVPLSIGAASRVALFVLAVVFVAWRPSGPGPSRPVPEPGLISSFMQWDAGWYEEIARNGYSWKGAGEQSTYAFFPAYPMLARVISWGLAGDVHAALFLISNVAFLVYLVYLFRLARLDFDHLTAERATLYVALFPLAYYFSAGYAEALFLALATGTLYHARRGQWWLAVSLGGVATLTRLAGVTLVLSLAWEWHAQKRTRGEALGLLMLPGALGCFMLFAWANTGDPLAFATVQAAWDRRVVGLGTVLSISNQAFDVVPFWHYFRPLLVIDLSSVVVHLVLLLISIRRFQPSYWLYSLPVYLLSTLSLTLGNGGLPTASIGRYLMSLFPHFILLGELGRHRLVHYLIIFLFAILGAQLALNFFAGAWTE